MPGSRGRDWWRSRKWTLPKPVKKTPEAYWVQRVLAGRDGSDVEDWKMLVQIPWAVVKRETAAARGYFEYHARFWATDFEAELARGRPWPGPYYTTKAEGVLRVKWINPREQEARRRIEVVVEAVDVTLAHEIGPWPDVLILCFETALKRVKASPKFRVLEELVEVLEKGTALAEKQTEL